MKKRVKGIQVSEAAKKLGIGSKKLFIELRKKNLFTGRYPKQEYIEKGYFSIELKQFKLPGSGCEVPYHLALVTPSGIDFLKNHVVSSNT